MHNGNNTSVSRVAFLTQKQYTVLLAFGHRVNVKGFRAKAYGECITLAAKKTCHSFCLLLHIVNRSHISVKKLRVVCRKNAVIRCFVVVIHMIISRPGEEIISYKVTEKSGWEFFVSHTSCKVIKA